MLLMALHLGLYPCMEKFSLGDLSMVAQRSCFVMTGIQVR